MTVELNAVTKKLNIQQEITFYNNSKDTLNSIVLNDWNNAYSSKSTPLANRFSDEFYNGFHLAKDKERGSTINITILNSDHLFLNWERPKENPDLIMVRLREKLAPNHKTTLIVTYTVKIPSDQFTGFGYGDNGSFNLKNYTYMEDLIEHFVQWHTGITVATGINCNYIESPKGEFGVILLSNN